MQSYLQVLGVKTSMYVHFWIYNWAYDVWIEGFFPFCGYSFILVTFSGKNLLPHCITFVHFLKYKSSSPYKSTESVLFQWLIFLPIICCFGYFSFAVCICIDKLNFLKIEHLLSSKVIMTMERQIVDREGVCVCVRERL